MCRKTRGFTLVELFIVIIVVSVLAGIAIPKVAIGTRRAKEASLRQTLTQLRNAQVQFYNLYEAYPDDIEDFTDPNPTTNLWTDNIAAKPWGNRKYLGPILQQGIERSDHYILDPVSGKSFSVSRLATGELSIKSSATGRDSRGVLFSTY